MSDEFTEIGASPFPGLTLRCICEGHTDFITRMAWQRSGDLLASPSADKTIRIWDSRNGTSMMTVFGDRSLKSIRVHTRQQRKPESAWEGFYEWPHPNDKNARLPYYDIDLS